MTVEEAEKILGIERNMSYEEVLRVRAPLSCLPALGVVAAVFGKRLMPQLKPYSCITLYAMLSDPNEPL